MGDGFVDKIMQICTNFISSKVNTTDVSCELIFDLWSETSCWGKSRYISGVESAKVCTVMKECFQNMNTTVS